MTTQRRLAKSSKTREKVGPAPRGESIPPRSEAASPDGDGLYDVLVLTASAGGQAALLAVLRQLSPTFDVPILVMQHLPPESTAVDMYLNRVPFAVQWADAASRLEPRKVLLCPPRSFVELMPDGSLRLSPSQGALDKPMDRLLQSAARSFAHRATAVVLTGMGDDAAAGALELHRAGGRVLVQSKASAEHPDMPAAAIRAGAADLIVPLSDLGQVIGEIVSGTPRVKAPSELEAISGVFGERGEIARIARDLDWSQTPLGPVLNWPMHLRVMIRMAIESTSPMCISWGPELAQLYNDELIPFLGPPKHPLALGRRARDNWPEIWGMVGPMFERVTSGGEPTGVVSAPFYQNRDGVLEEVFATLHFAPIRDPESGVIVGVHQAVTDTTAIVVAERRMRLLRNLASRTTGAATPREACERAAAALADDTADVPFALIYQIDESGRQATLAGATGLLARTLAAPRTINVNDPNGDGTWPFRQALTGPVLLDDLTNRVPALTPPEASPSGTLSARSAMLLPLTPAADKRATAVLIAGLSPHRPLDDDYRSFLDLVAQQIASGKNEARARQLERERVDRLAELDRLKTEFFANVSHEFRTPLTLLLTPLEEMLQRRKELPEPFASEIEAAARNSRRLLRLVNDLLDFSEMETRRRHAPLELTNLSELTHDIASAFRSAIERAGLIFEVDCAPMPLVPIDRNMWEKIVSNLLSNALKFTFEGGISVGLKALPMHAELTIADSGGGIPSQELPNVFKRFHRVRGVRARTLEGSGLGLAIVHDLVARMGGQLAARSTEGRGTTFTIWMPFKAARHGLDASQARAVSVPARRVAADLASEAAAWVTPEPAESGDAIEEPLGLPKREHLRALAPGARVLIVDDNADMRDYLRRLLGAYWQVSVESDGAAALASARELKPDLVLADVMMPGMDGFGLLRAIRGDDGLKHTPVTFLTARAGEDAAIEGLLAGADDYLTKPFSARELIARVGGQIELSRTRARAQAALLESESKYRTLFESMDEGFFLCDVAFDADGRPADVFCVEANPAAARIAGQDFTGRRLSDIAPNYEAYWFEIFGRVAKTSVSDRFIQYAEPHGKWLDCFVFKVGSGEDGRVAIIFHDITERRLAEDALRASEEKLRAFISATSDTVYEMSSDWRLMYSLEGKSFIAGTERTREDWTDEYIPEDEKPRIWSAIRRAIEAKRPFELEHRIIGPDGGTRWTASRAIPLLDQRGDIVKWFCTASDITERKRAEAALRTSEEKYHGLFEAIDEGFAIFDMIYDAAGEPVDFRYVETNPAFERQAGRRPRPGQTMRELFPEAEDMWLRDYAEVARNGQPKRFVDYNDGLDRWFEVFVFPMRSGKNRLAALFRDVTESKQTEAALGAERAEKRAQGSRQRRR